MATEIIETKRFETAKPSGRKLGQKRLEGGKAEPRGEEEMVGIFELVFYDYMANGCRLRSLR